MPNQQSILFLTHLLDERVLRRFQHLYESAHNQYDIYFGWHCENTEAYIVPSINYDHIYTFCVNDLLSLNYSPHGNSIYHNFRKCAKWQNAVRHERLWPAVQNCRR